MPKRIGTVVLDSLASPRVKILIIGGTRFVGHATAEAALAAGHEVTLLHRNATDQLPGATHLLADRDGDLSVLAEGRWDATIDVCAYLPGQVSSLQEALGERGGHNLLVSSISAYAEPGSSGADEDAALLPEPPPETQQITAETYGPLKVACERVARERLGGAGLAIIRPSYVLGPRDLSGRYPWWVLRAARGGRMILPGPSNAPMQCVDVRDLGSWAIRLVENRTAGAFTAARPTTTFEQFLADTAAGVGVPVELTPIDADFLAAQGVGGAQLPLWTEGECNFTLAMSTLRSEAAGLTHRPFVETVRDTLAWARANPELSNTGLGLSPGRERELIEVAPAG